MYVPIGTAFRIEKLFSFEGVFKHEVFATYEDPPEEIRNCWVKLTRKLGARDYWTFIGTSGQIEDVHLCKVATDSLFKRCGFRNSFWVTIKEIKDDKPV